MKQVLDSLKSGNWKALLACFLYFDTGFTVWVMLGPLAPFVAKSIAMTPAEQGFLVAVPVLAAAILRVTWGNLFQSYDGRLLALAGIALSAIPELYLLVAPPPSYTTLLVLGVFLGMGGASFAVALPMAGSNYPPKVQGLVLGLAAAGNIGAVLDGFLFPGLAEKYGWQLATVAALPLLAITATAVWFWAKDLSIKSGSVKRAIAAYGATLAGLVALVLMVSAGVFGAGKTGLFLLPLIGSLLAVAVLPQRYRTVFAERDTWVMMLVYSITFGGFVGMSSYVSTLLTTQYAMSKVDAGLLMSLFALTGAVIRPVGGWLADRVTGVRALLVLLAMISALDLLFAATMPPVTGCIAILLGLYLCFGLGNGSTFQLVPQRWKGKTGVMTGVIGAAGGIGGFYLPVIMGIAKESTNSYQMGFVTFGVLAAAAFVLVVALRTQWLSWAVVEPAKTSDEMTLEAVAE
ncbi:MAG TPA: MFS transporter [Nevskiaceae bacterium]|nr:MFS transporter [Nevskiaceae bacterium]